MPPMKRQLLIFILLILTCASGAHAIMDMKNANYSDVFRVMRFPKTQVALVLTYNSRSLHDGAFGYGWCSSLEDKLVWLTPQKDKVRFIVCGDGVFVDFVLDPSESNNRERIYQSKDMSLGRHRLTETDGSFTLEYGAGSLPTGLDMERFDSFGHLIEFGHEGRRVILHYKGELISEIADDAYEKWTCEYSIMGKIRRVKASYGDVALFDQTSRGDLRSFTSDSKLQFGFSYDDLHNLLKIDFPDKTYKSIRYDQSRDWVVSFRDRDGCVENYDYSLELGASYYTAWVTGSCNGIVKTRMRADFVYVNKQLAEAMVLTNGSPMKVKYDPRTGSLVRKDEGDHVIFYYYDSVSGQLIRRRIARSTENTEAIEGDLLKNKIHGAIH